MKRFILFFIVFLPLSSFTQNEEDTTIYEIVEKMPEFQGGEEKLYEYLMKNIKFPKFDYKKGIPSKYYLQFIVEKDSSISNMKIWTKENISQKKIPLELINKMPNWIPGEQKGKKVRVKYTLPVIIHFR